MESGIVPATTRTGCVLVMVRASGSIAISPPDGIRSSPLTRTRPVATLARPLGLKQAASASTSPKRTLDFAQVAGGRRPALEQRQSRVSSARASARPSPSAVAVAVAVAVGVGVISGSVSSTACQSGGAVADGGRRRDPLLVEPASRPW